MYVHTHGVVEQSVIAPPASPFAKQFKIIVALQTMRIAAGLTFVLLLILVVRSAAEAGQQGVHNVLDFHAAGDGTTDDTKAFLETWQTACNDTSWPILVIPGGRTFLLSLVRFHGPCKSPITVQLEGNIVAPNYIWTQKERNLLTFYNVDNLTMNGNGHIDGKGDIWWTSYKKKICNERPILLAFSTCNNLSVRSIHLKDSPYKHMTFYRCSQVRVHNVTIAAPHDSPNTDGINMALSHHVSISSCNIQTGDDCISILTDTTDVNITDITCGPGHGISVGSLGSAGSTALVERIRVSHCTFYKTMNGVRIKSWQGGKGRADGFLFEKLNMIEVQHPIMIDQFYCPHGNCPPKDGGVAITDARFINIQGTSSRQQAIEILCSQSVHCQGIYLDNVQLSWSNHTAPAKAVVLNAHGTTSGTVIPNVQLPRP